MVLPGDDSACLACGHIGTDPQIVKCTLRSIRYACPDGSSLRPTATSARLGPDPEWVRFGLGICADGDRSFDDCQ